MSAARDVLRGGFAAAASVSAGLSPLYRGAARLTGRWRIPVLVYHKVTADTAAARALTCAVSEREFAQQMAWLHQGGYRPIDLETYLRCREQGRFAPGMVLLTFDDGYRTVYTRAGPILKEYGFPAVLFLTTGTIGATGLFPADQKYADRPADVRAELEPLSWDEARALRGLVTCGSHTVTHPHLARLTEAEIRREVMDAKACIERELQEPALGFAYPYGIGRHGDHDARTRAAVRAAGHRLAFVSEIGRNGATGDAFAQRRIEPKGSDSRAMFRAKLVGAYDWAGWAQSAFHRVFAPEGRSPDAGSGPPA